MVVGIVATPLLAVIAVLSAVVVRLNRRMTENFDKALAAALAVQSHDLSSVRRVVASVGGSKTPDKPAVPDVPTPALHVTRE